MNLDVEIYVSQFKTFFKENPIEFVNLIGKGDPEKFFIEVGLQSEKNLENGEEIELTKKQLINIVLKINNMGPQESREIEKGVNIFMDHPMGKICLN